ncbi:MAG: EH signature domain-containing protein [Gammaproteobacteria bacterium]|nr:EH signature domain-containing protein [Gammaproteobacteria bacterium]
MFTPLPSTWPALEAAVHHLGGVEVPPPPPIQELGRRLRGEYEKAQASGYADLRRSAWRKLPYAIWLDDEPGLSSIHPRLVTKYWEQHLPDALSGNPRGAKRWLAPLLYTYCEHFDAKSYEFATFATRLAKALNLAEGAFAEHLRELQAKHEFFEPANVAFELANWFFLGQTKSVDQLIEDLLLWPGFCISRLGVAIFDAALAFSGEQIGNSQTISRLMDWSARLPTPVVKTDFRVPFADALLRPWASRIPADSLKNLLVDYFLKQYGDPRLDKHRHFQWEGVSEQAKAVLFKWLTGDTLRGFLQILQRTADEIWQYRQKFWMAYYDNDCVDEAWVALGDDAQWVARGLQTQEKGMGSGRLEGGATKNQSVLLLKIGGLVFTEWSHNGSLRAYREDSPEAPRLYQRSYHGGDLRALTSMDFHEGKGNKLPELMHLHSDKGSWQKTAREFIKHHTGIHLSDAEIV